MSNQPEAIRWACLLEREAAHHGATDYKHKAAAEMRRLHALNGELIAALDNIETSTYEAMTAALARAAIARAEGQT
jgi:hypothetical protein